MACGATLKRTMDFDPLMNPASPKRRRCAPLSPSSSGASPQKYLRMEPSPFGRVSSALTTEQILSNIKQEYKRMQKRRHLESSFQQSDSGCGLDSQPHASISSSTAALPGVSSGSASPSRREQPLFTLKQVGMICERLLKEREEKVREEYDEILTTKLAGVSSGSASPSRREQPLFTLKQVGMICERLLKEREEKVREEYDEILTTKLAEQYDAFVKFTHDQLMRRFGEQPASCKCPLSSHSDACSLCLPHTLMLMLSLCRCVLSGRAVGRPRVLWLVPCPVDLCLCELLTLRPAPAGSPAVPIASFPPLGTEYVSGFCQCVTTLSLCSS
ncbi:Akirin-2 [Anabarilius grahami]|uniref:Akirin-2 n=1 Tax=Anabarilius grahami TaxID=495550 RepID=A0A3N0YCQ1_ANAGA|nr:Akirin-2 [Anabarilius grahami]